MTMSANRAGLRLTYSTKFEKSRKTLCVRHADRPSIFALFQPQQSTPTPRPGRHFHHRPPAVTAPVAAAHAALTDELRDFKDRFPRLRRRSEEGDGRAQKGRIWGSHDHRRQGDSQERELRTDTGARQTILLLAAIAAQTPIAVGCYCEDESHCHRSVLKRVITEASKGGWA